MFSPISILIVGEFSLIFFIQMCTLYVYKNNLISFVFVRNYCSYAEDTSSLTFLILVYINFVLLEKKKFMMP